MSWTNFYLFIYLFIENSNKIYINSVLCTQLFLKVIKDYSTLEKQQLKGIIKSPKSSWHSCSSWLGWNVWPQLWMWFVFRHDMSFDGSCALIRGGQKQVIWLRHVILKNSYPATFLVSNLGFWLSSALLFKHLVVYTFNAYWKKNAFVLQRSLTTLNWSIFVCL